MGNVLCNLSSKEEFPPLYPQLDISNRFSWLSMLEDMDSSGEPLEESSSSNSNSLSSNNTSLDHSLDHSFQEALCREKTCKTEDGGGLNYIVLKKSYLFQKVEDSRRMQPPSKKVSEEDSG